MTSQGNAERVRHAPICNLLLSRQDFRNKRLRKIAAEIPQNKSASPRACAVLIGELLGFSEAANDERIRRSALKSLLALLPQSLGTMRRLLADFSHRFCFEVHFSLINLLDPDFLSNSRRVTAFQLLETYLLQVPSERAAAAWLAGHKLGFHWDIRETYPFLLKPAKKGKHPIGRKCAVYGLQEGVAGATSKLRRRIIDALEGISRTDASSQVRRAASASLSDLARNGGVRKGRRKPSP
jgi:hypothetical protein